MTQINSDCVLSRHSQLPSILAPTLPTTCTVVRVPESILPNCGIAESFRVKILHHLYCYPLHTYLPSVLLSVLVLRTWKLISALERRDICLDAPRVP